MIPISLADIDNNFKSFKSIDKGGVYFIIRSPKKITVNIDYTYIGNWYKDILYIGTSENSFLDRQQMHIESFLGTKRVNTPKRFAECAKSNGHTIQNLYVVCFSSTDKEKEIRSFMNQNGGKKPCCNTRIK